MNTKRRVKIELPHILEYRIGKWLLTPGVEVSLKAMQGRFRFQYASTTSFGKDVLTFVGGKLDGQTERFVSVYPDRVTRVHRIQKTLTNITKGKRDEMPHSQ